MAVNEKTYRPAWRSYYKLLGVMALLVVVLLAVCVWASIEWKVKSLLALGVFLICLVLAGYIAVQRAGIVLTIRPDEVALDTGIMNRNSIEISYSSLRTVEVSQTLFQRILNLGTVSIASSGTGGYEMKIPNMPAPHAIRDEIQALERNVKQQAPRQSTAPSAPGSGD